MANLIIGGGPPGLAVSEAFLKRGQKVHLIANYLPDGTKVKDAPDPAYKWAAGIQQPFGGSDPKDIRLRLYMASHPSMIARAKDPKCGAVRSCQLTTLVPANYTVPTWSTIVEDYTLEGRTETYMTAAFDPPGLMLYQWEQLLKKYEHEFSYKCRTITDEEIFLLSKKKGLPGYDRTVVCGGLEGSKSFFHDGTDYPILGVLIHFNGDGKTNCWMDEQPPFGTSGKLNEPDCLYLIRRPLYLHNGKQDPTGRIVLGGTIKHHVDRLSDEDLSAVANSILAGCRERFGETFNMQDSLHISQCRRPGNTNGFQIEFGDDGKFCCIRGPAGMGIVTAKGAADEITTAMLA